VTVVGGALPMGAIRTATKKAGGSSNNGRDSNPKYLGVKKFGGEQVLVCPQVPPTDPTTATTTDQSLGIMRKLSFTCKQPACIISILINKLSLSLSLSLSSLWLFQYRLEIF
jgi:hypothetical protein